MSWLLHKVKATVATTLSIEAATGALLIGGSAVLIYFYVRSLIGDLERHHKSSLQSKLELVNRLALAAEYRDDLRGGHNYRIGHGSAILARLMGLPPERCDLIGQSAVLHDIGKIGVPDSIISKPGPLTDEEREIVQRHVLYGAHLLEGSDSPVIQTAHTIALTHHERWDGSGYPYGLVGEKTPVEGRIVAVVDVFDALTSKRPYKAAWTVEEARAFVLDQSGKLFDPAVVAAFEEGLAELLALREKSEALVPLPEAEIVPTGALVPKVGSERLRVV